MSNPRILIVEDSFLVAFHLQKTLEEENYREVVILESAESAITYCEQTKPDIIFMDIMLSGKMDGIEAASIIYEQFDIPVVFISALTDKASLQRAVLARPYGYLKKPFEDKEVIAMIKRIIPEKE